MSKPIRVAWLRIGDLRLRDNPALWYSSHADASVVPVFVWCPKEDQTYACPGQVSGGHRNWSYEGTTLQALLAIALRNLDASFSSKYSNRLQVITEADAEKGSARALVDFMQEVGAVEVHYNMREEPVERRREEQLKDLCRKAGIQVKAHSAFLFRDPDRCPIFDAVGRGLHVFKAFWDGWHKGGKIRAAVPEPRRCPPVACRRRVQVSDSQWPFEGAMPTSRVTGRPLSEDMRALSEQWDLTEEGAHEAFMEFQAMHGGLARYRGSITRDAGPKAKESRLSPYFRLGLLSMVDAWWQIDQNSEQGKKWLRRCAWRDYAYWMLHHWADLPEVPMRPAFMEMQWERGPHDNGVEAWKHGQSGYPLVDAAMRELKTTGYLQQNLRHTVSQFLVETLGADWRDGEEWFHIVLADSDFAINAMMWQHQGLSGVSQWLIGIDCHPVRHARSADPQGHYTRKWVPELAKLPLEYVHSPWSAPPEVLAKAGVSLGRSYPFRVVEDVDEARARFLASAVSCRSTASPECFSGDGCDLLTLPKTSGLSMKGIRALTEKCFRAAETSRSKGKGKGEARIGDSGSCGSGKGKAGKRNASQRNSGPETHEASRNEECCSGGWRTGRGMRAWSEEETGSHFKYRQVILQESSGGHNEETSGRKYRQVVLEESSIFRNHATYGKPRGRWRARAD